VLLDQGHKRLINHFQIEIHILVLSSLIALFNEIVTSEQLDHASNMRLVDWLAYLDLVIL
jgi:hypothetical protein